MDDPINPEDPIFNTTSSNGTESSFNTTGPTSGTNTTTSENSFIPVADMPFYEFVIFMIPCFLFILISLKRLATVANLPLITHGSNTQMSFYIKKTLSFIHVFIYAMQLILAVTQKPDTYWVSQYRSTSLVYIVGIMAWVLSARLLDKDVEKGVPQKYYVHRLFWILHFITICFKLAEPLERLVLPLILNIVKLVGGFYLTLYALGKPFDTDEEDEANGRTNPLPFVRALLVKVEGLEGIRSLFGFLPYDKDAPLLFSRASSDHEGLADDFKNFVGLHNIKQTTSAQAGDWLKYLPVVTCTISRDVVAKEEEAGKLKVHYEVKTNVGDDAYTRLHKYADFIDLEDYIKRRCDPNKVAWIDRSPPEFEKVEVSGYPDEKSFVNARIEILERYLNILGTDPRYMNDKVLEFLGITDPHRSAFMKYIAYLATNYKKKTTPMPGIELGEMSSSQKRNRQQNDSYLPSIKVRCSHSQKSIYGDHYEYIFVVSDERDPNNSWSIIKSYGDFKTFHEKLEKAANKSIPFLNQYVPKPLNQKQTMDPTFIDKRKQGLDTYINMVLKQPSYHTKALYEFLEYDLKRGTHASINFSPGVTGMSNPE